MLAVAWRLAAHAMQTVNRVQALWRAHAACVRAHAACVRPETGSLQKQSRRLLPDAALCRGAAGILVFVDSRIVAHGCACVHDTHVLYY